tara:strand:+ start:28224 stop:29123 length:900 start_codon:yes stop_codon:yes gene_type:complete
VEYHIEKLASPNAVVGEGPVWNSAEKKLYWTDIYGGKLFKYDPDKKTNEIIHNGVQVGGLRFNESGGLLLGSWEGILLWKSDKDIEIIKEGKIDGTDINIRVNDVISGPDGSFYCGTDATNWKNDVVFRINPDRSIDVVDEGVELCNGMGFSPDERTFYNTDSLKKIIYKWDYNKKNKSLSNKRVFVKLDKEDMGIVDGMTVDSEGFIWSAIWFSSKVLRFDPDGKLEREISFPATQTSCPAFGGKDLNELYVTTANSGTGEKPSGVEPKNYNFNSYRGGDLFRVKLDIQGKLEYKTKF